MNQKRYLQELAYHLRSLPKEARDDIIEMYSDQFKIAELEGRSEEDTILLLGRAKANADKELAIHADQIGFDQTEPVFKQSEPNEDKFEFEQTYQGRDHYPAQSPRQTTNIPVLILLIIVNIMFVLGPALAVIFAGLGLWLSSIILMASPLIAFWQGQFFSFPEFYPVLAVFGLGVLLFVAVHYLSKLFNRIVHMYFNWMSQLVKG